MIKSRSAQENGMSLEAFSEYNKSMFYDATIPPDGYTALADAAAHHVTTAELTDTLKHRFKANKSSGQVNYRWKYLNTWARQVSPVWQHF